MSDEFQPLLLQISGQRMPMRFTLKSKLQFVARPALFQHRLAFGSLIYLFSRHRFTRQHESRITHVQTAHTATVAAVNNGQFNIPFVWHPSPQLAIR
jgi:hypothetical protein